MENFNKNLNKSKEMLSKETLRDLDAQVKNFDEKVANGNLPTVEEYKLISSYRARLIRHNIIAYGGWGKKDLNKVAKGLERAASGDVNELINYAMERSVSDRRLFKESLLEAETWKRLAELVAGAELLPPEANQKWKKMDLEERQNWLAQLADENNLSSSFFIMSYIDSDFDEIPYEYQKILAQKWGLIQ